MLHNSLNTLQPLIDHDVWGPSSGHSTEGLKQRSRRVIGNVSGSAVQRAGKISAMKRSLRHVAVAISSKCGSASTLLRYRAIR